MVEWNALEAVERGGRSNVTYILGRIYGGMFVLLHAEDMFLKAPGRREKAAR